MWRFAGRRLVPILRVCASPSLPKCCLEGQQCVGLPAAVPAVWGHQRWLSAQPPTSTPIEDAKVVNDDAEDLGIATGLELEELLAERKGKKRFDLEPPRGPFGTKEAPAIIQSMYNERIVGCSGGYGEDEHDVLWFRLKEGELHECRICSQIFKLEVVGPGGPPGGHHHHH